MFSSYLGGTGGDQVLALAVRNQEIYLAGATDSPNFPTMNAIQRVNRGGQDAFVAKLSSSGLAFVYSTYLGGTGGSPGSPEGAYCVAVDSTGAAALAGTTPSRDFPLTAALKPSIVGSSNDAFITKLSAAGDRILFSTFFGGSSYDAANGIVFGKNGELIVAGQTVSTDLPVVNSVQPSNTGVYNGFLCSIVSDGQSLGFVTYWGGGGSDSISGMALDAGLNLVLAGLTTSWNFPVTDAQRATNGGNYGGFISVISGSSTALARDFNSDGWNDLLWQAPDGAVSIALLSGLTTIGEISVTGPTAWRIMGAADFDHDGVADLVWQYPPSGEVWVWLSAGGGLALSGPTTWSLASVGDLDGDGNTDIFWTNPVDGSLWVWFLGRSSVQLTGPTSYRLVGLGDFNQDGHADLVMQNSVTGELAVWFMNGTQMTGQLSIAGATTWLVATVADFTGDGKPDIVWRYPGNGSVWIWAMNGVSVSGSTEIAGITARWPK
jgi:hypothetical protein